MSGADEVPDYYQLLGIIRTANADQIRSAFHRFAREHHPDNFVGSPRFSSLGGDGFINRARDFEDVEVIEVLVAPGFSVAERPQDEAAERPEASAASEPAGAPETSPTPVTPTVAPTPEVAPVPAVAPTPTLPMTPTSPLHCSKSRTSRYCRGRS